MSIYATVPGTLGKDAELRHPESTGPVLSFSIATNDYVKGEKTTTWVRCSLFGSRGEKLAPMMTKGSKVTAVGRLTMREYQGKTSLELAVNDVELMGGGSRGQRDTAPRDEHDESKADGYAPGGADDSRFPF